MSVETVVIRKGRIIVLTELFMLRCDSFLNHLAIVGKIGEWEILGEEWDVVNWLISTCRIKEKKNDHDEFYFVPAFNFTYNLPGQTIDPTVLSLAEENPANAEFVRVYRKNARAASAA